MPILENRIYRGVIHKAKMERLEKTDGGVTSYIKIRVQVPGEGFADTELYLTQDAFARTKKVLVELNDEIWEGSYPYLLRDPAPFLVGRLCKIETERHVFKNKAGIEDISVRVKWLNGVIEGKPATDDDVTRVLAMMGIDDNYVASAEPLPDASEAA